MGAARDKLKKEIVIMLGGTLVDVELEDLELNLAIDITLDRYRQRSGNSLEESYVFMKLVQDQQTYQLPEEIQVVKSVLRMNNGQYSSTTDPFSMAYANNLYMMNSPSAYGNGNAGSLALYDFAAQYQELAARMFGRDIQFTFNPSTKRIQLARRSIGQEEIALEVMNAKPEEVIMNDYLSKSWIRSYAIAQSKLILGQGRGKFSTFAGPQGGITMNGAELKQEAQAEIAVLDKELIDLVDQSQGYPFIIG